jgi:hypothetical protein
MTRGTASVRWSRRGEEEGMQPEHGLRGPLEAQSLQGALAEVGRSAIAVAERRVELLAMDLERALGERLGGLALVLFASSFAGVLAATAWMAATVGMALLVRERFGLPEAVVSLVLAHVLLALLALKSLRAARRRR